MSKNIAFKCTYNNGGEGLLVGFSGTCSEDIIKFNVKNRRWCGQPDNSCQKYFSNGFVGRLPTAPCYESELFTEWKFGTGWYHTGGKAGTPIRSKQVGTGKYAILTTRFPNTSEEDRKIIGFFKIGQIKQDENTETILYADPKERLRLSLDEASELNFWDYYRNKNGGKKWGTGLFRYLEDDQVANILFDLRDTVRGEENRMQIKSMIDNTFSQVNDTRTSLKRIEKIMHKRKYGRGGEGPNHKRLKIWVHQNPDKLGISEVIESHLEYTFPSGDTVDVLFKQKNNRYSVVEIETDTAFPAGAFQALKYKVLTCAENGYPIESDQVKAFLVAWSISESEKFWCSEYGIHTYEKKV